MGMKWLLIERRYAVRKQYGAVTVARMAVAISVGFYDKNNISYHS